MLADEVRMIKSQLSDISEEVEGFERDSQRMINDDNERVLSAFRRAIDSILHTVRFLGGRQTGLLTDEREAATHIEAVNVNRTFESLRKLVDAGLVNVKAISGRCHTFDERTAKLRSDLLEVNKNIERSLDLAKDRLITKQDEAEAKTKSHDSKNSDLAEFKNDMANKKEDRNVMRFFRAIAWTASVVIPVAAVPAAIGLEAGAAVMRKKRRTLQARMDATATDLGNLDTEIATLQKQKLDLTDEVEATQELLSEASRLDRNSLSVKSLVKEMLIQYQELKEATDDFAQWCTNAHGQSDVMVVLDVDEISLRQSMQHLINSLQSLEQESLRTICQSLNGLRIDRKCLQDSSIRYLSLSSRSCMAMIKEQWIYLALASWLALIIALLMTP